MSHPYDYGLISPGAVVQTDTFPKLFWLPPGPNADLLMKKQGQVRIRVCYSSFYDECCLTSNHTDEVNKRASCSDPPQIQLSEPSR